MNKPAVLNLDDLIPADAYFELSKFPEKKFRLKAYTLRLQLWAEKRFTKKGMADAIGSQDLAVLSELALYAMDDEDKKLFPTLEDLQDAIVSYRDRSAFLHAILDSVGLNIPAMEKISKDIEAQEGPGKPQPQSDLSTGESSTI